MTAKGLDSGATGILILIIPVALALVVLFAAWPLLLALIVLGLAWQLWQHYQWKKWSRQVNPYFNQLIQENQGCVTPMDLSLKANLTGDAAQRFLEKKAQEYGAQRKDYADKGSVYYFLTASAIGSMFDESEPPEEFVEEEDEEDFAQEFSPQGHVTPVEPQPSILEAASAKAAEDSPEPAPAQVTKAETAAYSAAEQETGTAEASALSQPQPETKAEEKTASQEKQNGTFPEPTSETARDFDQQDLQADQNGSSEEAHLPEGALIQAELARRLEVHSSTVGKRKTDPDFAEWSQSRDPDGIAWVYSDEDRVFIPQGETPE